ncbi:MAG: hypothetical protein AB8H80_22370 [Planctomycetota bacterium]
MDHLPYVPQFVPCSLAIALALAVSCGEQGAAAKAPVPSQDPGKRTAAEQAPQERAGRRDSWSQLRWRRASAGAASRLDRSWRREAARDCWFEQLPFPHLGADAADDGSSRYWALRMDVADADSVGGATFRGGRRVGELGLRSLHETEADRSVQLAEGLDALARVAPEATTVWVAPASTGFAWVGSEFRRGLRPVMQVGVQAWEAQELRTDLSLGLGLELLGGSDARSLRAMFEYYEGPWDNGYQTGEDMRYFGMSFRWSF